MGKKLERLKRWLPWADRAVGAPGAVGDWKELASKIKDKIKEWGARGTPTVALTVLWPDRVRGWIMDSGCGDMVLLGVALTIQIIGLISLARWVSRKRREDRAEAKKAKRETEEVRQKAERAAEEARRETRAQAVAERLTFDTWNVARNESEIHPDDARTIAQQTAEHLVAAFIRQHPEAYQSNPPRIDRAVFIRWLVSYRKTRWDDPGGKEAGEE